MEKKKNFIINVIFYAMIGTAAFGVCKFVLPALVPFLIAFLLCLLCRVVFHRYHSWYESGERDSK